METRVCFLRRSPKLFARTEIFHSILPKNPRTTLIPINGLIDIDECQAATHNCHGAAHCYNNEGSFSCECRDSYTGDGILNCDPLGKLVKLSIFIKTQGGRRILVYQLMRCSFNLF